MSANTREQTDGNGTIQEVDFGDVSIGVISYVADSDGASVIEIEGAGRLRVYVNEGVVFDQGTEESGPHGECGYLFRHEEHSGLHRCTLRSGHGSQRHACRCGAEAIG